jgi:hypothetical protein
MICLAPRGRRNDKTCLAIVRRSGLRGAWAAIALDWLGLLEHIFERVIRGHDWP